MDIIILKSFLPEFFLSISILFQLIYNIKIVNNFKYNFPIIDKEIFYQTLFILISLLFLYSNLKIEGFFSNFLFINDESTRIMKIFTLLTCSLMLHALLQAFSLQRLNFFEFFVIFLLSIFSLLLLISASDLISFYLVIEMQSLCFYILASFKRDSSFSTEAGLKYFISGAFISGIFLFGSSLLYGCLGSLNFNVLNLLLSSQLPWNLTQEYYAFLFVGVLCVIVTLLFKLACAPFHFWAPDVYEGSPLSSTMVFSIVPKIAIVYFLLKFIFSINELFSDFEEILIFCGALSITLGTFYALAQKRFKKLIIYSSISQIGFIIIGLATNNFNGYVAVMFFLVIYIITSILIWSHIALFYNFQQKINTFYNKLSTSLFISSLTNFFQTNKLWSFSFLIVFFSIGGIPPLTGFLSKILILFEVINNKQIYMAAVLLIISSISVFYYIRVIKVMFFEPKNVEKSYEKFQVIFHNVFLDNIYMIFIILLLVLLIAFFYPTMPLLSCQYIILNLWSL